LGGFMVFLFGAVVWLAPPPPPPPPPPPHFPPLPRTLHHQPRHLPSPLLFSNQAESETRLPSSRSFHTPAEHCLHLLHTAFPNQPILPPLRLNGPSSSQRRRSSHIRPNRFSHRQHGGRFQSRSEPRTTRSDCLMQAIRLLPVHVR
jgi:hypothetical protein